MDLIEVLPPGLYEMILEERKAEDVGADLLPGQYLARLRRRVAVEISTPWWWASSTLPMRTGYWLS